MKILTGMANEAGLQVLRQYKKSSRCFIDVMARNGTAKTFFVPGKQGDKRADLNEQARMRRFARENLPQPQQADLIEQQAGGQRGTRGTPSPTPDRLDAVAESGERPGMQIAMELIGPKEAEAYLNRNPNNRALRPGSIEKYAADMRAGRWTQCTQSISFYADGTVADGQHRLWAIMESGTSQWFVVCRGLPREAGLNIDTGTNRSLVDNAKISGSHDGRLLTNEMVSYARAIEYGARTTGVLSNAERLELVERHRDAAEWVIRNGPTGRGIRNGMVMSAIARAWMHGQDEAKLKRYCEVLSNGFAEGAPEAAAVAMRNYLLAKGSTLSSMPMWRDTFLKVQNSIVYFMKGKPLTVIKGVAEEAYPLIRNQ